MTTYAKGHEVKTGFKKATTWGTAVAVGAGDGLYILNESIQAQAPRILDKSVGGSVQMRGADISAQTFAGQLVLPGRYEGRWLTLLALLLGTAGAPTGTGTYVHTFKPSDATPGFGTLVLDKQIGSPTTWEYDSVMVDTVRIASQAGTGDQARAQITFGLVARKLNRSSAVNTATQIGALTFPSAGHLLHHNLTIRMNANSGSALASPTDVLKVRSLDLMINRNLKKDLFYSGAQYIDQPEPNDFIDVTGTLTLDRYSGDSLGVTEFLAGTYMKMDLEWTTGASAIFHLDLPYIQLTGGDRPVAGPGLVQNPIPFQAFKPSSAPTGMTATDLIQAVITNTSATDYLA